MYRQGYYACDFVFMTQEANANLAPYSKPSLFGNGNYTPIYGSEQYITILEKLAQGNKTSPCLTIGQWVSDSSSSRLCITGVYQ